jgi:hypothetical protein
MGGKPSVVVCALCNPNEQLDEPATGAQPGRSRLARQSALNTRIRFRNTFYKLANGFVTQTTRPSRKLNTDQSQIAFIGNFLIKIVSFLFETSGDLP